MGLGFAADGPDNADVIAFIRNTPDQLAVRVVLRPLGFREPVADHINIEINVRLCGRDGHGQNFRNRVIAGVGIGVIRQQLAQVQVEIIPGVNVAAVLGKVFGIIGHAVFVRRYVSGVDLQADGDIFRGIDGRGAVRPTDQLHPISDMSFLVDVFQHLNVTVIAANRELIRIKRGNGDERTVQRPVRWGLRLFQRTFLIVPGRRHARVRGRGPRVGVVHNGHGDAALRAAHVVGVGYLIRNAVGGLKAYFNRLVGFTPGVVGNGHTEGEFRLPGRDNHTRRAARVVGSVSGFADADRIVPIKADGRGIGHG